MSQNLQAQVYACQYCDHILHNAFNLKEHEQRCKEKAKTMKQETFLCPHCQRICDNTHNLKQHAKACIGIQMNTVHASRHHKQTYMQR